MLYELSLFTGIAGFTLGLRLAGLEFRTVGYVESDRYCQQVIQARIRDGLLDWAPIVSDIRAADFRPMAGLVDIITAGFPCQPFSTAGRQRGEDDPRNLWPETRRAISEVGPAYVLLENTPGILRRQQGRPPYGGQVTADLARLGYLGFTEPLSAEEIGASHRRSRWWVLAHSHGVRRRSGDVAGSRTLPDLDRELQDSAQVGTEREHRPSSERGLVADPDSQRRQGLPRDEREGPTDRRGSEPGGEALAYRGGGIPRFPPGPHSLDEWAGILANGQGLEPAIWRVADGLPHRLDRIRALGNSVVPGVVSAFLRGE